MSIVYPEEVEKEMATEGSHYLADSEMPTFRRLDSRRRKDWLAGRMAAKKAFVAQSDLPLQAVLIDYKSSGQPFYIGHEGFCSISHSYGWGAAVFSAKYPVGIDIESPRSRDPSLLEYIADTDELEKISALNIESDDTTLIWVVKEAIMKAEGIGLTDPHSLHIGFASWHAAMPIILNVKASSAVFSCQSWSVYIYIMQDVYLATALPSNTYEKSISDRNLDHHIHFAADTTYR